MTAALITGINADLGLDCFKSSLHDAELARHARQGIGGFQDLIEFVLYVLQKEAEMRVCHFTINCHDSLAESPTPTNARFVHRNCNLIANCARHSPVMTPKVRAARPRPLLGGKWVSD